MVAHIQPVSHLHAIAIDRQRFARQRVHNHQRNQLLGKMQRAVVIAAIRCQHRQTIGVMPSPNQMIAGRLAGRIRAIGFVVVVFREGRICRRQRAIDLIGRNMQKTEICLFAGLQTTPVGTNRLQQSEGANHIGLNKVFRAMDGTIHMAFGRKVHHRTGLVLCQQLRQLLAIANISLYKDMAFVPIQACQIFQIARISQLVDIDHWFIHIGKPVKHKIGANKACATSDKNHKATPDIRKKPA